MKYTAAKDEKDFWTQKMPEFRIYDDKSRDSFFRHLCEGKNVLHVGCTDYPLDKPLLHEFLSKHAKSLDGMDVDAKGIDACKKVVDGDYYTKLEDVDKSYDMVLVPETLEHVGDVSKFLHSLSTVDSKEFFISVPFIFNVVNQGEMGLDEDGNWWELVHPDHNCWYTPYTLKNVIEKYSELMVTDLFGMCSGHMVCAICEKVFLNDEKKSGEKK